MWAWLEYRAYVAGKTDAASAHGTWANSCLSVKQLAIEMHGFYSQSAVYQACKDLIEVGDLNLSLGCLCLSLAAVERRRGIPSVVIDLSIMTDVRLTAGQRAVVTKIEQARGCEKGEAFVPSQRTIAHDTGLSQRSLSFIVSKIMRLGRLAKVAVQKRGFTLFAWTLLSSLPLLAAPHVTRAVISERQTRTVVGVDHDGGLHPPKPPPEVPIGDVRRLISKLSIRLRSSRPVPISRAGAAASLALIDPEEVDQASAGSVRHRHEMLLNLMGAAGVHPPPYAKRALFFARTMAVGSAPILGLFLSMRAAANNRRTHDLGAVCWKLCYRWYMDPTVFDAVIRRHRAQREHDRAVAKAKRELAMAQIRENEARFEKNKDIGRLVLDAYRKGRSADELATIFGMSKEDISATIQAGLFGNTKRLTTCS